MSAEITIKLVRSSIGKPSAQRAVLAGLGLKKVNGTVTLKDTPETRGMIRKVDHLVRVEE